MSSNEEKIIRVKSKDDHDAVRLVNADAGDRLEWNKWKRDEEEVDRFPPVPGALSRLYRLFPSFKRSWPPSLSVLSKPGAACANTSLSMSAYKKAVFTSSCTTSQSIFATIATTIRTL